MSSVVVFRHAKDTAGTNQEELKTYLTFGLTTKYLWYKNVLDILCMC